MKQPDTHILTIADLLCNRSAGVFHAYLPSDRRHVKQKPRLQGRAGVNSLCGRNQRQRYADLIIAQAVVFFKYPLGGNQSRWHGLAPCLFRESV